MSILSKTIDADHPGDAGMLFELISKLSLLFQSREAGLDAAGGAGTRMRWFGAAGEKRVMVTVCKIRF